MENFQDRGILIRLRFSGSVSGSGFQIPERLDPYPVCLERMDTNPDPVNIRPDPNPANNSCKDRPGP